MKRKPRVSQKLVNGPKLQQATTFGCLHLQYVIIITVENVSKVKIKPVSEDKYKQY